MKPDRVLPCGTVLTHKESIKLFDELGTKFTPELKEASVPMPFEGTYTQEAYAQQLVDEYKAAGIDPKRVFAQSFNVNDVYYWINRNPAFGKQAVFLDARVDTPEGYTAAVASLGDLAAKGVRIVAPPMFALLKPGSGVKFVPSEYAVAAKAAGLDIITWTLERSGLLNTGGGGYYYQYVSPLINNDGDMLEVLDALTQKVKVRGIFSDWPATVTCYANCFGL